MKVSIVHPERRTQQTIGLQGLPKKAPKTLLPATRHTFRMKPGEVIDFFAAVDSMEHGRVSLVLELEADPGQVVHEGCLRHYAEPDKVNPGNLKVRGEAAEKTPPMDCSRFTISIDLQPFHSGRIIQIANMPTRRGTVSLAGAVANVLATGQAAQVAVDQAVAAATSSVTIDVGSHTHGK